MSELPGIDQPALVPWLQSNVDGLRGALKFELIAGGRSNLTYRVTDDRGREVVLRRPPVSDVLATAHDMGREHRVMAALAPTPVPVPEMLTFCDDPEVTGAPFYVMDFVDGAIVRGRAEADAFPADARAAIGPRMIEVLSALHAVEPSEVGLGDLGRPDGYLDRQLRRWSKQVEQSKTRDLPLLEDVHRRLAAAVPPQAETRIVHGDYRLDNLVAGPDGEVRAVLDWELCTLGDPLADLGLLMVYWSDPEDPWAALGADAATLAPGFSSRADLRQAYEHSTGRDLSQLGFYVAFGYWKLACILEGVLSRWRHGAMGDDLRSAADDFEEGVERLAEAAHRAAAELGI
ncbi:MAG TPA: phosphotransferase family protein [Acidimicrobiales bacterium]|nr:phosphotransferase family protein [Acidimicrobiales bacterium]